jgi:hypothetical protein
MNHVTFADPFSANTGRISTCPILFVVKICIYCIWVAVKAVVSLLLFLDIMNRITAADAALPVLH